MVGGAGRHEGGRRRVERDRDGPGLGHRPLGRDRRRAAFGGDGLTESGCQKPAVGAARVEGERDLALGRLAQPDEPGAEEEYAEPVRRRRDPVVPADRQPVEVVGERDRPRVVVVVIRPGRGVDEVGAVGVDDLENELAGVRGERERRRVAAALARVQDRRLDLVAALALAERERDLGLEARVGRLRGELEVGPGLAVAVEPRVVARDRVDEAEAEGLGAPRRQADGADAERRLEPARRQPGLPVARDRFEHGVREGDRARARPRHAGRARLDVVAGQGDRVLVARTELVGVLHLQLDQELHVVAGADDERVVEGDRRAAAGRRDLAQERVGRVALAVPVGVAVEAEGGDVAEVGEDAALGGEGERERRDRRVVAGPARRALALARRGAEPERVDEDGAVVVGAERRPVGALEVGELEEPAVVAAEAVDEDGRLDRPVHRAPRVAAGGEAPAREDLAPAERGPRRARPAAEREHARPPGRDVRAR